MVKQEKVWSRRDVVQGCPSLVLEARLAQLLQTWVAAVVGREREISTLPSFVFRSSSQGRHGQGWHRADVSQRSSFPTFLCGPCWELGPCTTSVNSQVSASLERQERTGAGGDQELGEIMTRTEFLYIMETIQRATS